MARILVIEDNPTNLQLIVYLLNAFGHQVLEAAEGEAGIEQARAARPDLVLCDVHLPGIDGYEVVRRFKGDSGLRAIPLVAVTALAMVGDREKVMAAGFDGYIPKPIAPEEFSGQVNAFFQPGQRTPAPVTAPVTASPVAAAARRATILVVDNSPSNVAFIRALLEPGGYQVKVARGVEEALALLQQQRPDLILSDLHMPGQNGYEFLEAVKGNPQWRVIPFLFLSSTVWNEKDQQEGLNLGATRFLLRPIEAQALLQQVEACLKGE